MLFPIPVSALITFLEDYFDLMIEPEQFETLYSLCVCIQIITNKLILMSNLFLQLARP